MESSEFFRHDANVMQDEWFNIIFIDPNFTRRTIRVLQKRFCYRNYKVKSTVLILPANLS